jgi:uncharacterized membrane protein
MSDLIVIAYPDEYKSEEALNEVERLQRQLILEVDGAASVVRNMDGKVKVNAPGSGVAVGGGALSGVLWGTLFGLLFFVPVLGAVAGGIFGTLLGTLNKSGIDQAFRDKVSAQLKPGTSALVMVVEKVTPDKAIEAMSKFGGTVLQTSLSKDAERQLQEALSGQYIEQKAA